MHTRTHTLTLILQAGVRVRRGSRTTEAGGSFAFPARPSPPTPAPAAAREGTEGHPESTSQGTGVPGPGSTQSDSPAASDSDGKPGNSAGAEATQLSSGSIFDSSIHYATNQHDRVWVFTMCHHTACHHQSHASPWLE